MVDFGKVLEEKRKFQTARDYIEKKFVQSEGKYDIRDMWNYVKEQEENTKDELIKYYIERLSNIERNKEKYKPEPISEKAKYDLVQKERTMAFTGHRPKELFGTYELKNPIAKKIMAQLTKELEDHIINERYTRFITGGALGFDQLVFICVNKLKSKYPQIENILAIPFENQPIKWKKEDQERYQKMKTKADKLIFVDQMEGYKTNEDIPIGEYSSAKMQKRNEYMVDESSVVFAAWSGDYKSGTGQCVRYADKKEKLIYHMNPKYDFHVEARFGRGY